MIKITSLANSRIKDIARLKEAKYRKVEKMFLVEGYHLVQEAYKSKVLKTVLITDEKDEINGVENILVNEAIIKKLSSTVNPQNIIGICNAKEGMLKGTRYLILDNINDPGNMGTLIRSALGFNIDTIIVSKDCVDIYNEKVLRSTQGAIFKIEIVEMDLKEAIEKLKCNGIIVIGTTLENSKSLKDLYNINKYAIILGNEANGVKKDILKLTDINVRIDMNKELESLNVGVAGGIIMHYLAGNE